MVHGVGLQFSSSITFLPIIFPSPWLAQQPEIIHQQCLFTYTNTHQTIIINHTKIYIYLHILCNPNAIAKTYKIGDYTYNSKWRKWSKSKEKIAFSLLKSSSLYSENQEAMQIVLQSFVHTTPFYIKMLAGFC